MQGIGPKTGNAWVGKPSWALYSWAHILREEASQFFDNCNNASIASRINTEITKCNFDKLSIFFFSFLF
jgi:hypothetical protein